MIDYYTLFKKKIPKRIRVMLKPIYLKWSLRSFRSQQYIKIRDYNFSIKLNPQNGAIDQYIYIHKNWEVEIGSILKKELKGGDTFIDVGANIGYFSLLASELIKQTGSVIAFEPIPKIVDQFKDSIKFNNIKNIFVRNIAIGDQKSLQKLSTGSGGIGGSSLVKQNKSGTQEKVIVSTLDEELFNIDHIEMIKIDVEGYEYEVLLGAKNVLIKHMPKIILEFSPNIYKERSPQMAKSILLLLKEVGYLIYDIENNTYVNDIDLYLEKNGIEQTNLFAYNNI